LIGAAVKSCGASLRPSRASMQSTHKKSLSVSPYGRIVLGGMPAAAQTFA
jgi:hypothetical protein